MARAGSFKDVDSILSWHPGDRNGGGNSSEPRPISWPLPVQGSCLHAAAAPEAGRSALDGVMLMNCRSSSCREHVPSDARIHYIISRAV